MLELLINMLLYNHHTCSSQPATRLQKQITNNSLSELSLINVCVSISLIICRFLALFRRHFGFASHFELRDATKQDIQIVLIAQSIPDPLIP